MTKPSRSDLRLYARAVRQGWQVPARVRSEIVEMLRTIATDREASRRERTSAARALMQATRVELDAIRVAHGAQYEDLIRRLSELEEKSDGELAGNAGEDRAAGASS